MAGYDWFRMYTEARTDKKLATLTDSQHRVWFNLLCLAAEQRERRGTVPAMSRKILAIEVANRDADLLTATIAELIGLEILVEDEGGALTFRAFEARQYDKPSDTPAATAQRKRDQRERERQSRPVTPSLNEVTPVSRDVTPGHAIDKNRREEIQTLPAVAIAPAGDAPAPARAELAAVAAEPEPVKTRPAPKPERDPKGPAAFQAFYADYPRKEARQDALAAWLKLRPDDDLCVAIMAGVGAWQASGRWTDPKYIPLPATFLNGRRWEDEPQPAMPARASPNGNGHRPLSTLDKIKLALGEDDHDGTAGPIEAVYSVAQPRQRPDRPDPRLLARPG